MRVSRLLPMTLVVMLARAGTWQTAAPGYHYSFPRDHFAHPDFQTEWWYYTGNLLDEDGHRFGYELTFFRQAQRVNSTFETTTAWRADQIYLTHFAVSNIEGHQFFHAARLNRSGPGLAGANVSDSRYWNGNWHVRWLQPGINGNAHLEAVCQDVHLQLDLSPEKPVVIHGRNGVSRKGPLPGEASHYLSLTRIDTQGQLRWKGRKHVVRGLSWMDHEFFSQPPDSELIGWDWFSIQLENRTEIMLYRLHRKGGTAYSSGTFIDEHGQSHFLDGSQLAFTPGEQWSSSKSRARYPIAWQISVRELGLQLSQTTDLKDQEMSAENSVSPTYWEGAVNYTGTFKGKAVKGTGYLEMTGYAGPLRLGN